MSTGRVVIVGGGFAGLSAAYIDNLFLAGDYMGVPSVNGALSSGEGAAHQVADLLASRAN